MNRSPMNYTGGKYKLLPQILPLFPQDVHTFVDLFCGGCNVGINVSADIHIYNDSCEPLMMLYNIMKDSDKDRLLADIFDIIDRYKLSLSSVNGYSFYGCESSEGLGKYNKVHYINLRRDFNDFKKRNSDYYMMFYVLIVYAFNNQIRFNSDGEFNLPVGKRDFNKKMEKKLLDYIDIVKNQDGLFFSGDFRKFDFSVLNEGDFVYADPPYLITCAAYNENGGWSPQEERALLEVLDGLNACGVKFALSNVMNAKGRRNEYLYNWTENNPDYRINDLSYNYKNANYQRKNKESDTREVLITNY